MKLYTLTSSSLPINTLLIYKPALTVPTRPILAVRRPSWFERKHNTADSCVNVLAQNNLAPPGQQEKRLYTVNLCLRRFYSGTSVEKSPLIVSVI